MDRKLAVVDGHDPEAFDAIEEEETEGEDGSGEEEMTGSPLEEDVSAEVNWERDSWSTDYCGWYKLVRWRSGPVVQWRSGAVARSLDSLRREPRFESCVAASNLGQVCSLYIAPVHSAV